MNKKKIKNGSMIVMQIYIISNLATFDYKLFHIYQTLKIVCENPYHRFEGNIQTLNTMDQQYFIQGYLKDLEDYPLLEQAEKIDQDMFFHIQNLCLNNPYVDYAKMADRIALTQVKYSNVVNKKDETVQGTTEKTYLPWDSSMEVGSTVHIYNLEKQKYHLNEIYYHELIHALFPLIQHPFLEEGLTDIMTREAYPYDDKTLGYLEHNLILKMWIETLGPDVFLQMRATGSLDSFKQALLDLDYSEEEISNMLSLMEGAHKISRASSYIQECKRKYPDLINEDQTVNLNVQKVYEEAYFKQLMIDVEDVYERRYHKSALENMIMCCYKNKLLKYYDSKRPDGSYDATYFEHPKRGSEIIWEDELEGKQRIPLREKDYNLSEKTNVKVKK